MRDAGVNLLFLSGNAVCWVRAHAAVVPLEPASRPRSALQQITVNLLRRAVCHNGLTATRRAFS